MSTPRPRFILSPGERESPLWRKLRAHMEERLADRRRDNDNDHNEAKTANLRGRIAELASLIALDRDPPATE